LDNNVPCAGVIVRNLECKSKIFLLKRGWFPVIIAVIVC